MARLIDADAYADEMRKKQNACRAWKDSLDEGTELHARAEQAFVTFVEAALTLKSQPTIDAIPVEWLDWRIEHARKEGFGDIVKMLTTVRNWWNDQKDLWREEREQEAR